MRELVVKGTAPLPEFHLESHRWLNSEVLVLNGLSPSPRQDLAGPFARGEGSLNFSGFGCTSVKNLEILG